MFFGTQLFFGRIILDHFLALLSSTSFSRELKVSHWCCTPCSGCSCNSSFGGVEVQDCAQGDMLNWCVSWGPKVVLPSFLFLPDFTKTSLSPLEESFGLAGVSFSSPVVRNGAPAATWLCSMAWSDFRSVFSRGSSLNSSYWWTINWPDLGFWTKLVVVYPKFWSNSYLFLQTFTSRFHPT